MLAQSSFSFATAAIEGRSKQSDHSTMPPFVFGHANGTDVSRLAVPPLGYEQERARLLSFHDAADINTRSGALEELRTSPFFSLRVKYNYERSNEHSQSNTESAITQYTLLGVHVGNHEKIAFNEPILHNTRTPFSTFICGSQGSGKSFTLNCMLENCLKPEPALGRVGVQQAGIVLHYDLGSSGLPSETAGLCHLGVPVQVLVSPSNYKSVSARYKKVADAGGNLKVSPLFFHDSHLTIDIMMKLMAFNDSAERIPLYMSVIQQILRRMAMTGEKFKYQKFRKEVDEQRFTEAQMGPMQMRFDLLDSFLAPKGKHLNVDPFEQLRPGTLTIIDLSCPFVDTSTARVLFDICLGLSRDHRPFSGLVIALDEAHKFIDDSKGDGGLTEHLLTTVREQRHNAVRVIIATQEPTISPKFLDLCSVSIIHRFSSPAWYTAIAKHLAGTKDTDADLLREIVSLGTGESLVFAPAAYVCSEEGQVMTLAGSCFKMKTRKMRGKDLGTSKLADEK